MAFIGFALLIAVGLAMVISFGAGQLVGLSDDQFGQIILLVLVLILVASGSFGRRVKLSHILNGVALWSTMLFVLVAGYSYREEISDFSSRVLTSLAPGMAMVDQDEGTAVFQKGFGNTFRMDTEVNGTLITMIFDTGASAVVLTNSDAEAAGINLASLRFNIEVQTANGTGRAAGVTIKRIEVGGIIRENIRAFVAEQGALKTSLLGMTFLQTLDNYTVSKDSLELNG
ncbi:MAG: TIGR02281 family clan AA aspartic protease [Devosiaceae bacterium]|nr:TIGR02281 family clan AA aspartic protease [Devosiaceae bacterium]